MKLVTLAATRPNVYVTTTTSNISNYYTFLKETLYHLKCLKLKDCTGDNTTDLCAAILLDDEDLESAWALNFKPLGYITSIFDNSSDPRFHIWATQNYKEVADFIKGIHVCDKDGIRRENIIAYGLLVQYNMGEYRNIFYSKQWDTTNIKKISQDDPLSLKASTVKIKNPSTKTVN